MWLSLLVIAALSIMGYFLGDNLISDMKVLFLKAGLFGRDLNKKSDDKMCVLVFRSGHFCVSHCYGFSYF
jgi:hypothetical protein